MKRPCLNVTQTAARLAADIRSAGNGWPICADRDVARLIGLGVERFGKREILIDMDEADAWAVMRRGGTTHTVSIDEGVNAIDDLLPIDKGKCDPDDPERDIRMIADTLAYWIRNNDPQSWAAFCQLPGRARRDRLNSVTEQVLRVMAKALARQNEC